MNRRLRVDFKSKRLELAGARIGQFRPSSPTAGELELESASFTYRIDPIPYGCTIGLYQGGTQVASRRYDAHEGIFDLRVGNDVAFDLNDELLYGSKGPAGRATFTDEEVAMEFNTLVREDALGLVAALVALDTMWANLVGFTRTRAQPAVPAAAVPANAADPDSRWLYRVGGISALVLGTAYIAIIPLYAHVGAPPSSGEAWLKYLSGKTTVWWAILGLSVLTDLLFVPVALSLYLALKRVHRSAMLLATAFIGLFVVLDLAVTWSSFAALLTLGGRYAAAANDVQRAGYVAAADYPSAVLASRLEIVYAIVILSFAILIIGIVMWKGVFSRATAFLGLITGILGIASLTGVTAIIIMNALVATAWVLFVGYGLYRLGQQ